MTTETTTKPVKPRLTWKREERETGLRSIYQGERGYDLRINGVRIGRACRKGVRFGASEGYYWYAGEPPWLPHKNTSDTPVATMDEAKAQCMAYVKKHLDARPV